MPTRAVFEHLVAEFRRPDPWDLESSPFEQQRYRRALELVDEHGPFEHGLEIGCAAGAFSEQLARRCCRLRVVDIMPEAIRRCQRRLVGHSGVQYSVADIADCPGWGEAYDLIVICEVLYYLPDDDSITRVIARLSTWLRPHGVVLFGSASGAAARCWGLSGGAEIAMIEWAKQLREVGHIWCRGAEADEHAVVTTYLRDG